MSAPDAAGAGAAADAAGGSSAATADLDPALIASWHAHVYFDAARRDAAWALRERIGAALGDRVLIGRFHERPVGPHPLWTYQLAFEPEHLAFVTGWLVLNHGALDVLLHPNTGDELADHRDRAAWIGRAHTLDLSVLGGSA